MIRNEGFMERNSRRLKVNDRHVKYDIAAAFDFILDNSKPLLLRAVKLYELQIAIYLGKKLHECQRCKKEHADNWLRVSRSALATARMLARVRLLENLIAENYPQSSRQVPLKKLVRDKEAMRLLRQIITPKKSKQLAYGLSWRDLDRVLTTTRIQQRAYVSLYHVSLNFSLYETSECKWTRAEALLHYNSEDIEYKLIRDHFSDLTSLYAAYQFKAEGNYFAAFIWLDHFGGACMRPTRPVAGKFAEKLLNKANNTEALKLWLGQYAYVRSALARQGYDLPDIRPNAAISPEVVSFKRLPDELTTLI
ncbi:hypothetical protein [Methylobacterium sp. WL116]|uniref:hypothetical protein n=1 Tax=Methylobacterium sp. WL116 TaxID=2603889 RepID=UPI0011CC2C49|nr:hypothetical protein [Methylobacterium sp. WL116]TXM94969.1 hypothetical protein FV223_02540 [Methylobacterium sp. WL116]